MTTIKEIRAALYREFERNMRLGPFRGDEARDIVRLEMTPKVEMDLRYDDRDGYILYPGRYPSHPKDGPPTLEGFSLYTVYDLPEPGWRVINPLNRSPPISQAPREAVKFADKRGIEIKP